MFLPVLIVSFACLFLPETTAQNGIYTPEAKGRKVVKDAEDTINGMGILALSVPYSLGRVKIRKR